MAAYEELKETALRETGIYHGSVFDVSERMVRLPNGREARREIVYHKGAAAIVPVDARGMVTLVRQFRTAHDAVMLEIPAGKLDSAAEDPLNCAHRELLEGNGADGRQHGAADPHGAHPRLLHRGREYLPWPTELREGRPHPDEDEFLSVERMPLKEAAERVMRGELGDAKTAVGLLMAQLRLC